MTHGTWYIETTYTFYYYQAVMIRYKRFGRLIVHGYSIETTNTFYYYQAVMIPVRYKGFMWYIDNRYSICLHVLSIIVTLS